MAETAEGLFDGKMDGAKHFLQFNAVKKQIFEV